MHADDTAGQPSTPNGNGSSARSLSARESEVLRLMCAGLKLKQIAVQLGIARSTAACHSHRIQAITGANNYVQLGIWAARNGFAT